MGKIVLIENVGLVCIKFKITLEKFGYERVETIAGPEIFLTSNESLIKSAKIIFIDSDNREINTQKVIKHIKQKNKSVKIIIMTSQGSASLVQELLSFGSDDVLAKPYSDVKLIEKVFKNSKAPTSEAVGDTDQIETVEDGGRLMPMWNEDLELGLSSIDDEHKELIENYENLYQKMKKGEGDVYCKELIIYLEEYVDKHFENEERFFATIDYGDHDKHKEIHDEFKAEVARIAEEFRTEVIDTQKQVKFNLFIKNWWMFHILVEDRKYVAYYQSQQHK